jgi:hypothetical protein
MVIQFNTRKAGREYNRITSTKCQSFCTTFSASPTNLAALLPQTRDCSCYVSKPLLAPPPLWLQKHIDLRAHDCAHSPRLWHQHSFANVTCAWSWRPCWINHYVQETPKEDYRMYWWKWQAVAPGDGSLYRVLWGTKSLCLTTCMQQWMLERKLPK